MSICYEWAMDQALGILTSTGYYCPTGISLAANKTTTTSYFDLPEAEIRRRFSDLPEPRLLVWAKHDETATEAWLIVEEKHMHECHHRVIFSKRDPSNPGEQVNDSHSEQHHSQPGIHSHSHKSSQQPKERTHKPVDLRQPEGQRKEAQRKEQQPQQQPDSVDIGQLEQTFWDVLSSHREIARDTIESAD